MMAMKSNLSPEDININNMLEETKEPITLVIDEYENLNPFDENEKDRKEAVSKILREIAVLGRANAVDFSMGKKSVNKRRDSHSPGYPKPKARKDDNRR